MSDEERGQMHTIHALESTINTYELKIESLEQELLCPSSSYQYSSGDSNG
jgi:hypothetical protein